MEPQVRRFEQPDERQLGTLSTIDTVRLGTLSFIRIRYAPGWRWSTHMGPALGQSICQIEHLGWVESGRFRVTLLDGRGINLGPGDLFLIPPGHDGEVVGDEPWISLQLQSADAVSPLSRDPR
jgi:hypothetical protein